MDESDSLIEFDDQGVCNHCRTFDAQRARLWHGDGGSEAARYLDRIVEQIRAAGRGRDYDCLLGLSGGIDSSYLAMKVCDLGLRPLAVHVDTGWNSDIAVSNIERIVKTLDIDLITEVIDWEEMRSLQVAFLRAGVANLDTPQDHAIFATLYRSARRYGVRYMPSGMNYATESVLPAVWGYDALDAGHLVAVNRRFGDTPLETFPLLSFRDYCAVVWRTPAPYPAEMIPLLNYLPYAKEAAAEELRVRFGFRDYGDKHGESRFTKFFQGHVLPRRFGYDKRRAHYSSLVLSGQIDRDAALAALSVPAIDPTELAEERAFVLRKLKLSEDEFEALMAAPARNFMDYPNNHARGRQVAQIASATARLRAEAEAVIAEGDRLAGLGGTLTSLADTPRGRPLYLYGGGRFGALAAAKLATTPSVDLRGFIDSFKSGALQGFPVTALSEYLESRGPDDVVLICSQFEDEIAETLQSVGIWDFLRGGGLLAGLEAEAASPRR
jgi:N-acetyl sugar amidotransferase